MSKTVVAKVKVKKFTEKLGTKSELEFLVACAELPKFVEKEQTIIFDSNKALPPIILKPENIGIRDLLSFKISFNDICHIMQQVLNFVRDPFLVTSHLKKLNDDLKNSMTEDGIIFEENEFPQNLIESFGHFIPDVFNSTYIPRKKNLILDELLSKIELKNKVNLKGYALKFVGLIDQDLGNEIVGMGNVFSENLQITRMLFHGQVHRILLNALMHAENETKVLNFKLKNGTQLSFPQFLELAVKISYKDLTLENDRRTFWTILFDSTFDVVKSLNQNGLDSNFFVFPCRVPETLYSLLRDFGHHFDLPYLRFNLLDSFYKQALQYVGRVQKSFVEKEIYRFIAKDPDFKLSDPTLYYKCMNFLSTVTSTFGGVQQPCFFTLTAEQALKNPTYETIYPGVVKKIKPSKKSFTSYQSCSDYYHKKVGKAERFGESLTNLKSGFFKGADPDKSSINQPMTVKPVGLPQEKKDSKQTNEFGFKKGFLFKKS